MWKAMIIIALAAIGCGDADSTPRLAPGGGFGGEGGTGGMAGFGGAGGVAVTTEEFRVAVPNFLEYFGGMDFPTWPPLAHWAHAENRIARYQMLCRVGSEPERVFVLPRLDASMSTSSCEPMYTRSMCCNGHSPSIRTPFTATPLRLPRSWSTTDSGSTRSRACVRETSPSETARLHAELRPMANSAPGRSSRLVA